MQTQEQLQKHTEELSRLAQSQEEVKELLRASRAEASSAAAAAAAQLAQAQAELQAERERQQQQKQQQQQQPPPKVTVVPDPHPLFPSLPPSTAPPTPFLRKWSAAQEAYYYVNLTSGAVQWEVPPGAHSALYELEADGATLRALPQSPSLAQGGYTVQMPRLLGASDFSTGLQLQGRGEEEQPTYLRKWSRSKACYYFVSLGDGGLAEGVNSWVKPAAGRVVEVNEAGEVVDITGEVMGEQQLTQTQEEEEEQGEARRLEKARVLETVQKQARQRWLQQNASWRRLGPAPTSTPARKPRTARRPSPSPDTATLSASSQPPAAALAPPLPTYPTYSPPDTGRWLQRASRSNPTKLYYVNLDTGDTTLDRPIAGAALFVMGSDGHLKEVLGGMGGAGGAEEADASARVSPVQLSPPHSVASVSEVQAQQSQLWHSAQPHLSWLNPFRVFGSAAAAAAAAAAPVQQEGGSRAGQFAAEARPQAGAFAVHNPMAVASSSLRRAKAMRG